MLLTILAALLLLAVGALIWVGSYADRLRDTNTELVTEKERLEGHIKTMAKAHHWHLENIAKIYLAEVQRLHARTTGIFADLAAPVNAAAIADEKLADLKTAMAAIRPTKPYKPRDAGGKFVKVAK